MGEGGAVLTSSTKLKLQIDSFRDWEEIVGVKAVMTIHVIKDMTGNLEIFLMGMITSLLTQILDTTLKLLIFKHR